MALLRRKFAISLIVLLALLAVGTVVIAQKMKLPPPQTASAAGIAAPDFTLADQSNQPYKLSEQRSHRVLVIFYRGYW
jgi:cytochrome oxidase Cu insertion factor (SCO1/SenC/PrrC family)